MSDNGQEKQVLFGNQTALQVLWADKGAGSY